MKNKLFLILLIISFNQINCLNENLIDLEDLDYCEGDNDFSDTPVNITVSKKCEKSDKNLIKICKEINNTTQWEIISECKDEYKTSIIIIIIIFVIIGLIIIGILIFIVYKTEIHIYNENISPKSQISSDSNDEKKCKSKIEITISDNNIINENENSTENENDEYTDPLSNAI